MNLPHEVRYILESHFFSFLVFLPFFLILSAKLFYNQIV